MRKPCIWVRVREGNKAHQRSSASSSMKDKLPHGISERLLQRAREKAQGIGEFILKCWSVTERKRGRKVEK